METLSGILFFTTGFITCGSLSGLAYVFLQLRAKDRERAVLDEWTTSWTADVMRKARWPNDEAARRATQP